MSERSLFDELGGEPALRRVIDRFVDRIFDDVMIGYLFRRADRARVKQKEFEHAAEHLGGPVKYRGKPLAQAHGPHRIMGGQFNRRRELLKEVETLKADRNAASKAISRLKDAAEREARICDL